MIIASDILKGVYRKLGRPSQADLPYQDVLDIAKDVVRERMLDYKLSARNHTVEHGDWVTPTDREMSVAPFSGGLNNFIPTKLEWRTFDSETIYRAEITSIEHISDLEQRQWSRESFAALYENFGKIMFSDTAETLANREYRLWFENLEDISFSSLSHNAELPALLITLIEDDIAFRAIEYVDNTTETWMEKRNRLKPLLDSTLMRNEKRFEQLKNSLYGNRKVTKIGYRPRR